VARAIARGYRASDVVPASDESLERLLGAAENASTSRRDETGAAPDRAMLIRFVERFDGARLRHSLLRDWRRMGPLAWLEGRVAPLIEDVGDAWETGWLNVRHEHFLSDHVGGLLRTLRAPLEERASGPVVLLATLPGEAHGLGVQMAALGFALANCRTVVLGTEMPPEELISSARDLPARAVALSVSAYNAGQEMRRGIGALRRKLPPRIALVVGGAGAAAAPAVTRLRTLAAIQAFAVRLGAGR
jgi:methylmalonyl-CoA mutase cobalamin-binding subunit